MQSGVPEQDGGVWRGATDFSEYEEGVGLPADITALIESGGQGFDEFAIIDGGAGVGNYFRMGGLEAPQDSAIFLDAFDLDLSEGEILARVFVKSPASGFDRYSCGPAFVCREVTGEPDFVASPVQIRGVSFDDYESAMLRAAGTGPRGDITEAEQTAGAWMWIRFRRQVVSSPSYRIQARSWYGTLDDEPGTWDYNSTQNQTTDGGAMGWFGGTALVNGSGATDMHRISFLGFTTDPDPDTNPPPTPEELTGAEVEDPEYMAKVEWA